MHNVNIQSTGLADVRNSRKSACIRAALASSGLAGALLLGGLFGLHNPHSYAHAQTRVTTSIGNSANQQASAGQKMLAVSYSASFDYVSIARQAAISAGINPDYFVRQIQQESGFNPNATSPAGAVGIAQFMPGTAAGMGVNPYDPTQALYGAARMMANLSAEFGGNYAKALAAYNAGPGTVIAAVRAGGGNWLSLMPAETQHYVAIIMG